MKKNVLLTVLISCASMIVSAQEKMIYVTSQTTGGDGFLIDHPLLNNKPNAKPVISHAYNSNSNLKATGVYYSTGDNKWLIYNEDGTPITEGYGFFIYVPSDSNSFVHTVTSNSTYSPINNGLLNNQPNKNVVISHVYVSGRNTNNIATWYDSPNWSLYAENVVTFNTGDSFHVAVSGEAGITSIRHQADPTNINSDCTYIDHPALNGKPNSKMVFTHNWGVPSENSNVINDKVLTAYYSESNSKWGICNEDFSDMPIYTTFDVFIESSTMDVNDMEAGSSISVYPNPIIDLVNFNSEVLIEKIELMDLVGRKVLEKKSSEKSVLLNVKDLPQGVYIALVKTVNNYETIKLIKK